MGGAEPSGSGGRVKGRMVKRGVENIIDVVRFTALSSPDHLVTTARTMVGDLTGRGWTALEAEQSYIEGNQYKDVHLLARHPSGYVAEFQFHTDTSQQVNGDTHLGYEQDRDTSTPVDAATGPTIVEAGSLGRLWHSLERLGLTL